MEIVVPEMVQSEGMYVIENGTKYSKTLGTAAITNGYLPGYSTIYTPVTYPKFDTYDYFEFDYFVDDIDNFKARVSSLKLALYHNSGKEKSFECIDKITKNGWNHVKVKISYDNDIEKIILNNAMQVKFYTTMSAGDVGAEDRYVLANICATKDQINFVPKMVEADCLWAIKEGEAFTNTFGTSAINDSWLPGNKGILSFSKTNFRNYDSIEFDIYVTDINNFKSRVSDMKLLFVHESDAHWFVMSYYDQITKDGWNHIKVVMPDSYEQSWHATTVKWFRFYITMSSGDVGANDKYKVANVCAVSEAHKYSSTATAPDCVNPGTTTYTCSLCKGSYSETVDALGHRYNAVVTDPTCTTEGYTTYTCGTCGDNYVDNKVDALGHKYDEVVTAPTCQAEGYTTHTCSVCNDTYTDNTTGVVDHDYVNGFCKYECGTKEPAIVYTFGHTMQIKPSEPFGLFFNGIVYEDGVVVDYDTLSDYGMYIIAAEDLEGEATVENIVANGKLFKKGDEKVAIGTSNEKAAICVTYDEALYVYEMDKVYYEVFFAADKNGNVSYGEVRDRSVNNIVNDYQGNATDYSENLINLCDKMDAMYEATTAYRNARPDRYEFNNTKPETFADKTFGAAIAGDYTFGHTMQLASCEPWALIFNAAVRVGGNVIDYSACDEYGVIVSDKAFTSIADVDASAYVYNNVNGGATVKGDYISVDYVEGIYSSEMSEEFYAMFYVVIDGQYYYGNVKTRSMMSVAEQYFANADIYEEDVLALLDAMKALYEASVAYKAAALGL